MTHICQIYGISDFTLVIAANNGNNANALAPIYGIIDPLQDMTS